MTEDTADDHDDDMISIHIPRVGDDLSLGLDCLTFLRFQSTSPVWGMTCERGALRRRDQISIHIPRVGDD